MHYPTVHPLLDPDPRTRATLAAELAQASRNPKLCPLMERAPDLWPGLVRCYLQLARLPRKLRRQLQRRWKRSLAGLALLLALGQAPALAASIDVDGTTCTLVDAITAANTDLATGGCPAGEAGLDTLNLVAGSTHTLTAVNNSTFGATGLPMVSTPITIEGNGSTITRDSSAPAFRIFAVNSTGNLTLNETTVSGGLAAGGFPEDRGGGVLNYYGTLTLTHSTVSGNSARFGGGVYNRLGTATLTHSTVSGNSASNDGGGIYSNTDLSTQTTLTNSTVSGNSAGTRGGGVFNFNGLTVIEHSTLTGNTAPANEGGGVPASVTARLSPGCGPPSSPPTPAPMWTLFSTPRTASTRTAII